MKQQLQTPEQTGYSYFLFFVITAVVSIVCVAVYQEASHEAGRILTLICMIFVWLLNVLGVASFAWRHWMNDRHQLFPHWLMPNVKVHGRTLAWYLQRILDHLAGFVFAWALVFLAVWMYGQRGDPNLYVHVTVPAAEHNAWAAWLEALHAAFDIFVGGSPTNFEPVHPVLTVIYILAIWTSWIMNMMIITVILSEGYAHVKRRDKETEGGGDTDRVFGGDQPLVQIIKPQFLNPAL